jgi:hypothetical protein
MLLVMYLLTRKVFRVRFEWGRLAHLVLVMGAIAALGDLFLPTSGAVGFITRTLALVAIPVLLWVTGFVQPREKRRVRAMLTRDVALGSGA